MSESLSDRIRAEHERGYITLPWDHNKETPGHCRTCVPVRPWPCDAVRAADALDAVAKVCSQAYRLYQGGLDADELASEVVAALGGDS